MSELTKIFLTSALTVLGGIFLLVVGQLVSRIVIDPLIEFKKALGKVRYLLIYHAREIHTPVDGDRERCEKASDAIRQLSSEVSALMEAIPFQDAISKFTSGYIPSKAFTESASSALIGISNTVLSKNRETNTRREAEIKRALWRVSSPVD